MISKILTVCAVIHLSCGQGITFKNGRVGVNFGGYEAEAGLGGILTGNAADGGLSASAKTPFGQQAGAGLGGRVDGGAGTGGGLYAGATAGQGLGASAALGGDVASGGVSGGGIAEAHGGGVSKQVVKVGGAAPAVVSTPVFVPAAAPVGNQVYTKSITTYVSPVSTSQTATRIDTSSDSDTKAQAAPAVQTQQTQTTTVQKVKTIRRQPQTFVYRKQFLFPKIFTFYKTFQPLQPLPPPPPPPPLPVFDFTKLFSFNLFANKAATWGGSGTQTQVTQEAIPASTATNSQPQRYVYHKQIRF